MKSRLESAAERHAQNAEDIKTVAALPGGRRLLSRIIYEFGSLEVLGFSPNKQVTAFNAGHRSVGEAVKREVRLAAPASWLLLEAERNRQIADDSLAPPPPVESDLEG